MRHERATEEIQETTALYALGSLSQHEVRAFEIHLREGCQVCLAELKRFESVVAGLGFTARQTEPPAYLRDLLTARIEREGRPLTATAPAIKSEAIAKPQPVSPQQPAGTPYLAWAMAAGFALLAAVSLIAWRQAEQQITQQRENITVARSEAEVLKTQLAQEIAKLQELEQIKTALNSPGARVIQLAGQEPAPSASAAIFWNTQQNQWVVTASLPPPPAGKVYQLWFVTPSARISAGLIQTDLSGRSFTVVPVPSDIGKMAAAAITLEPAGGSAQPTMPIYALGKVG